MQGEALALAVYGPECLTISAMLCIPKSWKVDHCNQTASMKQQHFWVVYLSLNCTSATVHAIYISGIHNMAEIDRQKQVTNAPSSIY